VFGSGTGGGGLAERIRQAQARLLADPATAHPFFWGAFALIGDGRTAITTMAAAIP
jgi:CHAT domain-containing protein